MSEHVRDICNELIFCLDKIEGIGKEEIRTLQQGHTAHLETLLRRKDELISRMHELYESVSRKLSDGSCVDGRSLSDLQEYLAQIQEKARVIIKNEHSALHKSMTMKKKASDALKSVGQGKKVLRSYKVKGTHKKSDLIWKC